MGPTALNYRPRSGQLSIAMVLLAALASRAPAQVPTTAPLVPSAGLASVNLTGLPYGSSVPPFIYGVDTGIGETDNVSLAPTDKVSQTLSITDLDFALNEQSRLLLAQAKGDFSFIDYLQGAYGSQLTGRFDGIGAFALVPGRLVWVVQDDFGQAAIDPYTPVTPSNMENVDYFSTGPNLTLRLGGLSFVNLYLRYARSQFSGSTFDSNRASAALAVGREISAGAAISLNADSEKVLFSDTAVNTNFVRNSVYGKYQVQAARTGFEVDLGATVIDDSPSTLVTPGLEPGSAATTMFTPAHSDTGPYARIQLSRQVSPAAKIIFSGGRQLTDASSSFGSPQGGAAGISGTANAIQSTSSYTSTFGSAGWQYVRNRTTLELTGRWEKDVYPGEAVYDLTQTTAQFSIQRQIARTFSAQLLGRYAKLDYPGAIPAALATTDYADSLVGLALAWRHGRALEVRLRIYHDVQQAISGGYGYHDNRAFLTVGYRPLSAPPPEEPQPPS